MLKKFPFEIVQGRILWVLYPDRVWTSFKRQRYELPEHVFLLCASWPELPLTSDLTIYNHLFGLNLEILSWWASYDKDAFMTMKNSLVRLAQLGIYDTKINGSSLHSCWQAVWSLYPGTCCKVLLRRVNFIPKGDCDGQKIKMTASRTSYLISGTQKIMKMFKQYSKSQDDHGALSQTQGPVQLHHCRSKLTLTAQVWPDAPHSVHSANVCLVYSVCKACWLRWVLWSQKAWC